MIKSYASTTPSGKKNIYSTKVYKLINNFESNLNTPTYNFDNVGFSITQYFVYKIVLNLSFVWVLMILLFVKSVLLV